jgi:hypothetical protein
VLSFFLILKLQFTENERVYHWRSVSAPQENERHFHQVENCPRKLCKDRAVDENLRLGSPCSQRRDRCLCLENWKDQFGKASSCWDA